MQGDLDTVDESTIEAWAAEITRGEVTQIRARFHAVGAPGPQVVWQPSIETLLQPQLHFLLRYWRELAGDRAMPRADEIDALAMRPALGFILLLDVLEEGRDFRYRLFGTALSQASGFDMTGHLISAHKASNHVSGFYLATYRAALRRQEPVFTEHGPAQLLNTKAWQRIVLPLADSSGAVMRFLVGNVPLSRDGRPYTARY